MRKLSHDRVVKLLGIILEDGNYSLVMEYVHKGNLMKVLKTVSSEVNNLSYVHSSVITVGS